jgi:hypothetical protein
MSAAGVLAAARFQLIPAVRFAGLPWLLLGLTFAINALFADTVSDHTGEVVLTGGLFALHISVLIHGTNAVNRMLTLAVNLGVTRRAYYAGACLFFTTQALVAGVVLAALRAVELRTDAWGIGLRYFDVPVVVSGGPVLAAGGYAASIAFAAALGMSCGAVTRRWGAVGTTALSAAAIVVPGLVGVWIARNGTGPAVAEWFRTQAPVALHVAWPTTLGAALALLGYLGVRRTAA